VVIPAYMTFVLIGFVVAIGLGRREQDRIDGHGERVVDLGIVLAFFGLLGARVLSVLADGHLREYVDLCVGGTDCLEVLKIWHGGLAYYGGLLVAGPIGMLYARRRGLGVWRTADLVAPLLALGLFFGRIGCFFNGCCYGRPTDLPWGVRFPGDAAAVHPTQLYEAAGALALAAALYLGVRPRKRGHGQVFGALLVGYAVLRFVLELWRDDDRGALLGLSTSQWLGIPLAAAGIVLVVRPWRLPTEGS
jgi:phosphatidylglycerol:prolipoprotein diacylglycerol transferase